MITMSLALALAISTIACCSVLGMRDPVGVAKLSVNKHALIFHLSLAALSYAALTPCVIELGNSITWSFNC